MVLISAHRGGVGALRAGENKLQGFQEALASGVEWLEFDVRRSRDGVFFLRHGPLVQPFPTGLPLLRSPSSLLSFRALQRLEGGSLMTLEEIGALLRNHGGKAHLDLKVSSPWWRYLRGTSHEEEVLRRLLTYLPGESVIATTRSTLGAWALRRWTRVHAPAVKVGLSVGYEVTRAPALVNLLARQLEGFIAWRARRLDLTLLVAHHDVAKRRLQEASRALAIPLLVWTVDDPEEQRHWLREGACWLMTTNYPLQALKTQAALAGGGILPGEA